MDNNTSNKTSVKVSVPFERRPESRDDRNFKKEYNLKNRAYRVGAIDEYHQYVIARDKYYLHQTDPEKTAEYIANKPAYLKEYSRLNKEFRKAECLVLETVESCEDKLKLTNSLYNEQYPKPPFSAVADYYWGRISGKVKIRYTTFKNDLQGKEILKAGKYMLVTVAVVSAFLCAYLGGEWCLKTINAYFVKEGFECTVKGTVTNNFENKDKIYFGFLDSKNPLDTMTVDSARIINGKFEFKVNSYYPAFAYLSTDLQSVYLKGWNETAVIFIEPRKTVSCVIDLRYPFDSLKVYNSPTYNDMQYVVKGMQPIDERKFALWHKIDSAEALGDTALVSNLKNQAHQFEIYRTKDYLNLLFSLDESSAVAIESYVFILLNSEYLNKQQFGEIEERFNKIPWHIKECKSAQRVKELIDFNKKYFHERYGQLADITAKNQYDKEVSLPTLLGKYEVLLYVYKINSPSHIKDFYRLKELYNSQQQGRIKVITLCLDGDDDKWKEDIAKHGDDKWVQLHGTQTYNYNFPTLSLYNRWGSAWNKWGSCTDNDIDDIGKYLVWVDKLQVNQF